VIREGPRLHPSSAQLLIAPVYSQEKGSSIDFTATSISALVTG